MSNRHKNKLEILCDDENPVVILSMTFIVEHWFVHRVKIKKDDLPSDVQNIAVYKKN